MSRFMSRFNSNIKITLLTLTAANLFAGGQAVAA